MARGKGMWGIPFITVDEATKKLIVHPEALRALRNWDGDYIKNVDGSPFSLVEKSTSSSSLTNVKNVIRSLDAKPIAVVAGCGKSRVGKSTLLTRMMRAMGLEEGGFETGNSTEPVTQGVWISPVPALVKSRSGEEHAMFFLDTEGTESLAQGRDINEKLLTLAFLLSTVVLFNERGNLEANTFETLKIVADMCTRVKAHADCEAEDAASLASFTPHLFFLLRDATLELLPSKEEYLERQLRLVPEGEPGQQWNEVRQRIRSMFGEEKRKLFSLSRPTGKKNIARVAGMDDDELDEEFVEDFHGVVKAVLQVPHPTVLGSHSESKVAVPGEPRVLTGPVLAGLAEMYVLALNAGQMPVIANFQSNVYDAMCAKYKEEARAHQKTLLCCASEAELKAEEELRRKVNKKAEEKFWEGARGLASAQSLEVMAVKLRADLDSDFKKRMKLLKDGDKLKENDEERFFKDASMVAVCFGGAVAGLAIAAIEAAAIGVSLPISGPIAAVTLALAMYGVVGYGVSEAFNPIRQSQTGSGPIYTSR